MYRKKVNKKKDKNIYKKTSKSIEPKNKTNNAKRGGTRL